MCAVLYYLKLANLDQYAKTNKYGIEIRTKNRSVDKVARILGASKHKLQEHRGYSEEVSLV